MKNTGHTKNVDGERLFLLDVNYYKEKQNKYEVVTEAKKIVKKKKILT